MIPDAKLSANKKTFIVIVTFVLMYAATGFYLLGSHKPISASELIELEKTSVPKVATLTLLNSGGRSSSLRLTIEGSAYPYYLAGFINRDKRPILGKQLVAYFYEGQLISIYHQDNLIYSQHPDSDTRANER